MKSFERVDTRPAYDKQGKIMHMVTSGGYVMVKRPKAMPFVLTLKEWAKLPKEAAASMSPDLAAGGREGVR